MDNINNTLIKLLNEDHDRSIRIEQCLKDFKNQTTKDISDIKEVLNNMHNNCNDRKSECDKKFVSKEELSNNFRIFKALAVIVSLVVGILTIINFTKVTANDYSYPHTQPQQQHYTIDNHDKDR